MKKTFSLVDEKRGIVQVTTDDERFYIREGKDPETGNPTHIWLPSASWISSYCPKGIAFYKWLADKGWDEAEAIKADRGKYGTRVHKAIELLLAGNEVAMDEELPDPDGGVSHLTPEEYLAVMHFTKWWGELTTEHEKVEVILSEHTVWDAGLGFAGTVDCVLKVDGEYWIVDFKTSQYVGQSYHAQIAAYKRALIADKELKITGDPRTFILQIGYKRTKKGYKLNEIGESYHLFDAARTFWAAENSKANPSQVEMPLKVGLPVKKNMSKGKTTKKTKK